MVLYFYQKGLNIWVLDNNNDNRYNPKKLTYDERKASLIQRVKALNSAIGGDDDDEEEDDG